MDIRSIIDADDAPPPRKRSVPGSIGQENRPRPAGYPNPQEAQTPIYQERRHARPPQPSPLQTPGQSDHWANGPSPSAVRSPYQQTTPFTLNSGQYFPPQIPSQSPVHGPQYSQRDNFPPSGAPVNRSFGPSTPLSQTPTTSTPGSAHGYSALGRPSSSHSIPTPNSTQQPPSYFRESPQASHTQLRTLSQSQTGPQHMSQPSTPLGPPSALPRSSFSLRRESPGSHSRDQYFQGGTYGQLQSASPSLATAGSPSYGAQHSQISYEPIDLRERERSPSVSPKTRLPSIPSMNPSDMLSSEAKTGNEQHKPVKRKVDPSSPDVVSLREQTTNRRQLTQSRLSSIGVNGLLNAAPTIESPERVNRHSHPPETPLNLDTENKSKSSYCIPRDHVSCAPYHASIPSVSHPSDTNMPPVAKVEDSALIDSPSKPTKKRTHHQSTSDSENQRPRNMQEIALPTDKIPIPSLPAKKKPRLGDTPNNPVPISVDNSDANQSTAVPDPKLDLKTNPEKKQKPRRWKEVPIWAQSVLRPNRPRNGNSKRSTPRQAPYASAPAQTNGQGNGMQGSDGHSNQTNGVHVPVAQPALENTGPLGPWEPSFLNVIPAEELVRIVSDWLFQNVVQRDDVGVGPAGGGAGGGAVLEIEAKIGQLIDKNTNDRIRLPVLNECVVSHTDPSMRIAFKSSMTEVGPSLSTYCMKYAQNFTLNRFNIKLSINSLTKLSVNPNFDPNHRPPVSRAFP